MFYLSAKESLHLRRNGVLTLSPGFREQREKLAVPSSPNTVLLATRALVEQVQNSKKANNEPMGFREAIRSKSMVSKVLNTCEY